ncbi:MAG: hypothetical protein IKH22_00640 [Prevotella sp.]|nr:hypothetical protein [Prevotella sp.]
MKIKLIRVLLVLLCLLPATIGAQSLNRFEYWFDDNYAGRRTGSLSGSDLVINRAIPTTGLDYGVHRFNLRVRRSDNMYSAVTSQLFLKLDRGTSNTVEYWFDDNIDNRSTIPLPAFDEDCDLTLDLADAVNFPLGFHKLNMRVTTAGGGLSAVSTSDVLKLAGGVATQLEYWFDDDIAHSQRLDGSLASTGDAYIYNTNLDLTALPVGLHRLNYRAVCPDSDLKSAVMTQKVMKLPSGKIQYMEYWVDGNIASRKRVSPNSTSTNTDIVFNRIADLGSTNAGAHRLYMRGVSADRKLSTAITSMPVMVKSQYSNINPAEVTVTEQAYWIDNGEPEIVSIAHPRNIVTQPYTFDTRNLSEGQHTLHMQFGNSAGIWNGPVSATFTKTKFEPPVITAQASVEEGKVTISFNSLPYGDEYNIVRQYSSGTIRKAENIKSRNHPVTLKSVDTPAPGTYTYYVDGYYTDANGERQRVRSNDMAVTVDKAAETLQRGRVHGVIKHNGERITNPSLIDYKIYINGERAANSGYPYRLEEFGKFRIDDVPYGTELTVSIEYGDSRSKDVHVIVNENTSQYTYFFDCSEEIMDEMQPNNEAYDLAFVDKVHITPDAWELHVRNKSRTPWSGNIIMKIISKDVKDLYDRDANEGNLSMWYYLFHPNAGVDNGPVFMTTADAHITLGRYEYKTLSLDILDLPEKDESEDYYVYVYSKKDGSEQIKELDGGEINSYRNPQTLTFNPFDCTIAQEKDFQSYVNDYKTILTYLKLLSKWGDPFALEINTLGKKYDDIIENLGNGKIDLDGLEQDVIVNGSHAAGMLLSCFLSDIHKTIKNTAKSVTTSLKVADGIVKVYDTLKGFYNAHSVDDNYKFFETSKQVLSLCKTLNLSEYPALSVYKSYFEVGEAMVSAVERLSNTNSGHYLWDRLATGNGIYKIKVRKFTGDEDDVRYFAGREFYQEKNSYQSHAGQIKSINIELVNPTNRDITTTSKSFDVELENDGIVIKNVDFSNETDFYSDCEAWMTIIWKNNRVTKVPLLDRNFVKLENLNKDVSVPLIMTVELQSETYMNKENIANQITFVKQ